MIVIDVLERVVKSVVRGAKEARQEWRELNIVNQRRLQQLKEERKNKSKEQ